MPLTPGAKLGPYEIRSPLGTGGMGEVYRAADTKLGRDVALKVILQEFARDTQLMAGLVIRHDPHPMQGLQVQLVIALDRYEAHRPNDQWWGRNVDRAGLRKLVFRTTCRYYEITGYAPYQRG